MHPLLGAHVRLPEEPERHVWQGDVGTAALPWLGDHQIHSVAALPGAAYCEMALAAARTVLGEASEVRDIRFEQMLLLDDETPVGAVASVDGARRRRLRGGDRPGRRTVAAGHCGRCTPPRTRTSRPRTTCAALLAAHPVPPRRRRAAAAVRRARYPVRSRFHRPGRAHIPPETAGARCWPRSALPGAIRSQQGGYGVHPALLDACFQSVAAHPDCPQSAGNGGLLLPLGVRRLRAYGPARNARYCYTTGDRVRLRRRGRPRRAGRARDGPAGGARAADGHRGLADQRTRSRAGRAAADHRMAAARAARDGRSPSPATWLLISTSDAADMLATELTDALKLHDAQCTTMCWPQDADHVASAERLRDQLEAGAFTGVVVLTGTDERQPGCGVAGPRRRVRPACGAHRPRTAGNRRARRRGCTS